ncbi:putative ATPase of the ABC class [Sphaerosporella brunnea]|uniref:Putative ATPase of the ABC class n=1 Tax=Sphaerosporella brunnea TaxID=1250544 RepID=A0A5J5FBB2_9PEZI|nr:putative ATPase of the ABC class [Sphaerosporella brunnea]
MNIHGQSYPTYKSLKSKYTWTEGLPIQLFVDKVQSDPYAPASRFRASIPWDITGVPEAVYANKTRVVAYCDYVNRKISSLISAWRIDVADSSGTYHGLKGGNFELYRPKQQVLERSSCVITGLEEGMPAVEIRFMTTLPANGRQTNGIKARELLIKHLPNIIEEGILWAKQDAEKVWDHLRTVEVQEALRNSLDEKGLIAFVGNGSILPRASGADPGPMTEDAIPFYSPESLEVTINTGIEDANGQQISITGMGIPKGIVVISGGGFHGKSTLLEALQFGIYNVVPGDGRELVVTDPHAFKIRAEDGRNVVGTDITPFISQLPGGKTTDAFTSMDASGSTSMAANIQEALEVGATTLIIDEDTSATNFLVRDNKMHELVTSEPITPLVSKVTALFQEKGVSTIIVVGGCGDYLDPATTVIGMESYSPHDWTTRAHEIAAKYPNAESVESSYGNVPSRVFVLPADMQVPMAHGTERIVLKADRNQVGSKDTAIDITALEQIVERGQANLCAEALKLIKDSEPKSVSEWVAELDAVMEKKGMNMLGHAKPIGTLARARPIELLATVNRLRGLQIRQMSTSALMHKRKLSPGAAAVDHPAFKKEWPAMPRNNLQFRGAAGLARRLLFRR